MSAPTHFPPEIIESILRRVPAKSLGRFKSVSKPWCSLISNPKFIKTHLLTNQNNHKHKTPKLILISDTTKSLYSLDINTETAKELTFPPHQILWEEILGSCNGLVLAKDENDTVFIINPTTRDLSKVPVSPFALPARESFVMYGFGYDSCTEDYKVISISFWDTDNEYNPDCTDMLVNVYSLRNDTWKNLDNSPYDHAVGNLISGVLVNEKLHWLTSTRSGYSSTIAAFSLSNEEFNEIELPDSIENDRAVFNELVELGGKLGMFGTILGNEMWVMDEYGVSESWRKIEVVGIDIDPVKPLCLVDGCDRYIVFGDEDGVVVYNVNERSVRIVGSPNGFSIGGTYVETLESPQMYLN
ncbi:F-box/kelch-repeat protein At3g06240-like [Rutidosis leptorrhynchoides]|uniref:F-box/kelch-repeat protein At3g06240-like n=1 Tax=Rutidosis leptorrhynchoides TaxID=125765 RepID=UPI003A99483A